MQFHGPAGSRAEPSSVGIVAFQLRVRKLERLACRNTCVCVLEFPLCLSRAYLGKLIILSVRLAQNICVFLPVARVSSRRRRTSNAGRVNFGASGAGGGTAKEPTIRATAELNMRPECPADFSSALARSVRTGVSSAGKWLVICVALVVSIRMTPPEYADVMSSSYMVCSKEVGRK
jgi:hypothetical protein